MKKKELKKQGIVFTYVGHETTEELDFITREEILGKDWDNDEILEWPISIVKGNTHNNWEGESSAMSISSLEEIIAKLKAKGANYIEIMYHTDHIEYEINGLEVHKASDEEIADDEKQKAEKFNKQKEARKLQLQKELKELE